MVGPARKGEAVVHLQRELELSKRRACKVVGQGRSTQRYAAVHDAGEERLRGALRQHSGERPRAGYRMVAQCLRNRGWEVSDKRVQRLWREEGLRAAAAAETATIGLLIFYLV